MLNLVWDMNNLLHLLSESNTLLCVAKVMVIFHMIFFLEDIISSFNGSH